MLRVVDAATGQDVERDARGAFLIWDQREYLVQADGEALRPQPPILRMHALGGTGTLIFDNYVGYAEVLGQRFHVRHGKLTEASFDEMLDSVVSETADLAFDFGSATALPFARDISAVESVAYHALAYLRHIMKRSERGEALLGHFLQIARNPHRRMLHEPRWVETASASTLSTQGLAAVVSHPERLVPLPASSALRGTGLGRRLSVSAQRGLFPSGVLVDGHAESVDTHENRLVKRFLRLALDLVKSFDARKLINPDLRDDVRNMREELEWMSSFEFLDDVDELTLVPFQSSVMQRREGYRDFLQHFVQLGMVSTLAGQRDVWERLLDLKDSALLYEIWCFFEVKRVLDSVLGEPRDGEITTHDDESRIVPWSARVDYDDCELVYNRTYSMGSGSYSVTLRPDIVVRRREGDATRSLVLDAKLKFDGARLIEMANGDPDDWSRTVNRADIYKMHTYRDAIREAVGAYVLYPGNLSVRYPAVNAAKVDGVGAVPLIPGGSRKHLVELLDDFLGR